ncbi:MAG TPA: VOC family protein [Thermoanaerobaculia bacterium]|nr:VOC family protein [Thermoanaerobaculia bacterium]
MATKKKTAKRAPARKKAAAKPKPRAGSGRLQMTSVSPSFTANDLEKSLGWYRDVLGFAVGEKWMRDGKMVGAELSAGPVSFMVGQDDWKKGHDRRKGEGFRLYCETRQDIDALARAIESRGGRLDEQPKDQPWGTRDFSMTDPDGFKITIASAPRS